MDQPPYSAWADLLNKFHTAPEIVQALMVVAGAAIVLGGLGCLTALLIQCLHSLRPAAPGTLLYGVYRTSDGCLVELRDAAALLPDGGNEEAEPMMRRLERSS